MANPSQIALESGLTKATVTGLLDALEKDGIVERIRCCHDRRCQHVKLSEKGMEIFNSLMPGYYRRVGMLMKTIEEHAREESINILTEIRSRKKMLGAPLKTQRKDPVFRHIHEPGSR